MQCGMACLDLNPMPTGVADRQELTLERGEAGSQDSGLAIERTFKFFWKKTVGKGSSLEAKPEFGFGLKAVGPSCFG